MKLRVRLALIFAVFTSLTIAFAFTLTTAVFRRAQLRSLDEALEARAESEADETALLGGRILNIEQAPLSGVTALSQLVKYGVLYDHEGVVVAHTTTFGDTAPPLATLGFDSNMTLPHTGFDLHFGRQVLRAVLVPVGSRLRDAQSLLLLAVPRDDLDADTLYLIRVMVAMFCGAVGVAIVFGLWFGTHMTRDIDSIATVARRISEGELDARVSLADRGLAPETRRLAGDLNEMIDRLGALITSERRFVSHAAHELRSPLSALRGELELALRHPRSIEAYKAAIGGALDDTRRLQTLAEDLLALARFGMSAPQTQRCLARDIIDEAVRISTARTTAHCRTDLDVDPAVQVRGQAGDLVRLVRNLVDNAISHAPAGSTVVVRATADGQRARITVEDDGPGVPATLTQQVFEPFFRGDLERADSGAGLGLAIAREIARAHRGDLTLESPRRPTRFVVWLPLDL